MVQKATKYSDKMVIRAVLLLTIFPSVLLVKLEGTASVSVPFTHNFTTGLHGWDLNSLYWSWTGNSHSIPETSHVPNFSYSGEIVWTQQDLKNFGGYMSFSLFKVTGVERSTKFTFKYWFYTESSNNPTGIYFYFIDLSSTPTFHTIKTITSNDNDWNELTIDCEQDDCCHSTTYSTCNLQIKIIGSVGYAKGYGIAAISSVSAHNSGSTLKSSHTLLAITPLVLVLFIIRLLSR